MKIVILAGGSGTRLWPLSRVGSPKQVQPFLDDQTLLQHTWKRLRSAFHVRDIFVATVAAQVKIINQQLPELLNSNLIIEPMARNTGPAIALATLVINQLYPGEAVVTVNSDHYIKNESAFVKILKNGEQVIKRLPHDLILFGIKPLYPETGYGYIKLGQRIIKPSNQAVYKVGKFIEKPKLATANRLVASGNHLWNSGMFLFYPKHLLSLLKVNCPEFYKNLAKLKPIKLNSSWTAPRGTYQKLDSKSFDYLLVEKLKNLAVMPMNIEWADVGHFRTIYDILSVGKNSNVVKGKTITYQSQGNLVYSLAGKLVSTVGVSDLIIVDTGDAVLVCHKDKAQEVKQLVEEIRRHGFNQYL